MKKFILLSFSFIVISTVAQVSTPLPHREAIGEALTLQQILDSARHNNIAIRSARQNVEAATQQRKEAFTKYFPNISGTGLWFNANKGMAQTSVNPSEAIPSSLASSLATSLPAEALAALASPISVSMLKNGTIAGITAMQPVFAGGQIVNGNRLAKVGEDVARLHLQLSENEVEKTVEQYYWQLVSLQEKMKTVAAVEDLLTDIHKDVEVAVRAGLTMSNDLLQVQLRQNEVESQKLKLQNGISIVKLLLAQYCGLRDTTFVLNHHTETEIPVTTKHDHQQALLSTAEYQLLDKQVEATRLQRNIEMGKNLPTIAVGAGYNYHNLLDRSISDCLQGKNNHTFGMIFATVSVPISEWWGGSHAVKRKKIAYQQAIDEQQDKAELLQIRMQNAWNNVMEARQQLLITQRSIKQSEENLRIHRNYYKAGTSTMSDLLEAQLLYQQSCDKHTDAYADLQNKLVEYRQSVGEKH